MNLIRGIKSINKDIDETQEFYKYRRSICDECSYNTKNGGKPKEKSKDVIITALEAVKPLISKEIEDSGNCAECTCIISHKCADKLESCPFGKWKALEHSGKGLSIKIVENAREIEVIEGTVSTVYNVYLFDQIFNDLTDFTLNINLGDKKVVDVNISCPCLQQTKAPELQRDKSYNLSFKLSTAGKERKESYHRVSFVPQFERTQSDFLVNIYFKVK